MRFTIVTVTLNSERHLKETMDSVAAQTFSDFEHLIWDGGSLDGTLEIVAAYPNARLITGKDTGISDAMNKGAAYASGDYLLFLHSDDALTHPHVLKEVDTLIQQNSNAPWVYGGVDIMDETGQFIRSAAPESFSAARLRKYNTIAHPATFLTRELFEKSGGFRTDLRYCMDYELWLRLAAANVVARPIPIIVAKFREHTGSLSTSQPIHVAQEAYRVRNQYTRGWLERFMSYRTWRRRIRKLKANDR